MEAEKESSMAALPENLIPLMNEIATRQMNMSDIYLSMSFHFCKGQERSLFSSFFDDQAEVKRFQAKRVLRGIKKLSGEVNPPSIERPKIEKWGTSVEALTLVLEMEKELTKLLKEVNALATERRDLDLLILLEDLLNKQDRNENYLKSQINYESQTEEQALEEQSCLKSLLELQQPAETPKDSKADPAGATGP